jgi:hypothetical protein
MFKLALSVSLLLISQKDVPSQTKAPSTATALSVLKSREPRMIWDERNVLQADFDFDGVEDGALGGRMGRRYVVGIVKGPVTPKSMHWILGFSSDPGDQGALCSVSTAAIGLEPLDVERVIHPHPNSKGIHLSDGACDSFHIYWDEKTKRFVWWRN